MTEKELLYFEDAIGHVNNLKKIIDDCLKKVQDEKIESFLQNESDKMSNLKEDLTNTLGGKANG